jgi:DNA polymerase-3 subunit gamma/tau
MSYLVLARKYRPQTFGEMSGQEHVVRTLSNALRSGRLAHAFLFTGPRGVGKTTAARLVAKAVNCEKGPTAEPCGSCAPCTEIAEGRCVDVIEIDAASNNGVDNVRDIVEAVKYRPARDRFKVFVVDEVHMLSTGAFNALLKTLEEPPEHVKFVLATTDVHRVPETIVSRCQRFDFRRLTQKQLVEQLRRVAEAEGIRLSEAALSLVARSAEGGMRDALSMLDQVRAACGEEASDEAVAEALGAVDAGGICRLAGALVRRDGAAVLEEVGALHARGQEMRRVADELVRHLRDVVVAKLVPAVPIDLPDAERREVAAQAEAAPAPQLVRLFDLARQAVQEVKESEQPRYALEVALLKACFLAPASDVRDLIDRLEGLGANPGQLSQPTATAPRGSEEASGLGPQTSGLGPQTSGLGPQTSGKPLALAAASPEARGPKPEASPIADDPSLPAAERWRALVAEVERESPAAAGSLKLAALVAFEPGAVSLRLPPGMPFSNAERRRAEIERACERYFGRPTALTLAQGEVADARETPSIAAVEKSEREERSARVRAHAQAHPKINEAAKILEGEVSKIDEL